MKIKTKAMFALIKQDIEEIWNHIENECGNGPSYELIEGHMKLIEHFDKRISDIEKEQSTHAAHIRKLERRIEASDKLLGKQIELINKFDPEIGNHAIRMERLEELFHDIPNRFAQIERKIDALQSDTLDLRDKVECLMTAKGEV